MSSLKSFDWFTLIMYLMLVVFGWFTINAASVSFDDSSIFDFARHSGKQMVWFGLAVFLIIVILCIDSKTYVTIAPLAYLGMLALLAVTVVLGAKAKGSGSWIDIGPIRFQPCEFGKITTAMMLGWLFSQYGFHFTKALDFIKACLAVFAPAVLIIAQNETGSALVYFSMVLLFYRQGMSGVVLWLGICFVLIFVLGLIYGELLILLLIPFMVIAMLMWFLNDKKSTLRVLGGVLALNALYYAVHRWPYLPDFIMQYLGYRWFGFTIIAGVILYLFWISIYERTRKYLLLVVFTLSFVGCQYSVDYAVHKILQPHQRSRVEVLLGLKEDLAGAGYNVNQAKIAIGSGGVTGKGYLQGTQTKMGYVPEQHTDFIFCTIGEEWGFVGSASLLLLYMIFILRLLVLAERQRTVFAHIYAYCVVCIFFFHVAINVGMVIGFMPVIGIPLPFFSYGGSSLWSFSILLFILLKLDASRTNRFRE